MTATVLQQIGDLAIASLQNADWTGVEAIVECASKAAQAAASAQERIKSAHQRHTAIEEVCDMDQPLSKLGPSGLPASLAQLEADVNKWVHGVKGCKATDDSCSAPITTGCIHVPIQPACMNACWWPVSESSSHLRPMSPLPPLTQVPTGA